MLTLEQMREVTSNDEALELVIDTLADVGFASHSWQSGSWKLTLCRLIADIYAPLTQRVAGLASIFFNETSTGTALTEFSKSHYANERSKATRAIHSLRLTANASSGPYTIVIGTHVFQEVATSNGYLFTCSALPNGATLPKGGTLDIEIQAQAAGAAQNVAPGTITELKTALAGVTCTNIDVGNGTSLIATGTDGEADPALQSRNTAKWGSLTWATPADGYLFYARQGSSAVARVKVDDGNPRGPGTVDVYGATASGALAEADRAAAEAFIRKKHAGTPDPAMVSAAAVSQNFSGNIYVASTFFSGGVITTAKKNEIENALRAYVNGLDIGGTTLPPPDGNGVTGYMLESEWKGAVTAVEGVRGIGAPSPAANVVVATYGIMTVGTIGFAYVAF